jgi:uncharacterized protein (TIGR02145 family)
MNKFVGGIGRMVGCRERSFFGIVATLFFLAFVLAKCGDNRANSNADSGIIDHFNPIDYDSLTDSRDGQTYRTVTIGTQAWMAQNLNFNVTGSWCYDNNSSNCDLYGRLYDWSMVMGFASSCNTTSCASQVQSSHRGICPVGWHVPSTAEWRTLVNFVGGSSVAGTRLRAQSGWDPFRGWRGTPGGTDVHGFSALPGGFRWSDSRLPFAFAFVGVIGRWWSATEHDATNAQLQIMFSNFSNVYAGWNVKANGYSLRCVKD